MLDAAIDAQAAGDTARDAMLPRLDALPALLVPNAAVPERARRIRR